MSFAPENPLEETLCRATSDPAARPQFYSLLMQSPLLVLGRVMDHTAVDEVLPLLDARHFELAQIAMKGRNYHAVFSSHTRLEAFGKETPPYFTAIGRTVFDNTRGAAFLLNCGSEVGKELLPEEIEYLLRPRPQRTPQPANRNEIALAQPDPYPGKLTGALGIFFLNRTAVAAAHLVEAVLSDKEPPHLLIGLVAGGDLKRLIAEIGEVAAAIHTTRIVDVMVLDPTNPKSGLQTRLLAVPPFYARPVTPYSQGPN